MQKKDTVMSERLLIKTAKKGFILESAIWLLLVFCLAGGGPVRSAVELNNMPFAVVPKAGGAADDQQVERAGVIPGYRAAEDMRRENIVGKLNTSAIAEGASGALSRSDSPVVEAHRQLGLDLSRNFNTVNLRTAIGSQQALSQGCCFGVAEEYKTLLTGGSMGLPLIMADGTGEHSHSDWVGILVQENGQNSTSLGIAVWLLESIAFLLLALFVLQHWRGHHRLKESEKRYRTLFENMTQGVFYQRSDGIVIACNPACMELLGLTDDQCRNREPLGEGLAAIHEDGSVFLSEQYPSRRALKTGKPVHEVVAGVYNAQREEYVWLSINAFPQFISGEQEPHQVFVTLHDITDIKKAHKALDSERRHLQYILEGTRVGTWEWNVVTGETILNHRWAEIIGYTLEEISPVSIETWIKFSHPGDLEESNIHIQRHLAGEQDYYEFEVRMRHKSGEWVWVLDRGKVVSYSAEGQPLWMAGTHTDITTRKRAEETLRETTTINQTILKTIPDLIWLKDPDGIYISCNLAFEQFFGVREEEIVGKRDCDINTEDIMGFTETTEQTINESASASTKEEWVTLGSEKRQALMLTTKTPIFDHVGRLVGVLGMGRDITEQFNTQAEVRQKESYQRALLDNFPFSVWLKDTESRFLAVNQSHAQLAGFSDANELLGKTDFDIWPKDLAETYRNDDCDVMQNCLKKRVVEEAADHNGRKWFEIYKAPVLGNNNELLGTVGFSYDITGLKQEEEMRILNLERQRDELIKEVNHRIKNHLQGLIGLLSHRKNHGSSLVDSIDEVITQIKSIAIVYGLQMERANGEIDLRKMLDAITFSISGISQVSLSVLYEADLENCKIDREKAVALSLVINELIMNAVKHTQYESHVAKVIIRCMWTDEHILLAIRNLGNLPQGFDFEGDRGMGTGLELVKVMLPSRGADLSISNEENEVLVELKISQPLLVTNAG